MKRLFATMAAAGLAVAMTGSAWAGGGQKCPGSTQECLNYLATSLKDRGWMGVQLDTQADGTMTVKQVVDGSPAQLAGLKAGDTIVAINGTKLGANAVEPGADMKAGSVVTYGIVRDKRQQSIQVKLAPMPDSVRWQIIGQHMLEDHAQADATKS